MVEPVDAEDEEEDEEDFDEDVRPMLHSSPTAATPTAVASCVHAVLAILDVEGLQRSNIQP